MSVQEIVDVLMPVIACSLNVLMQGHNSGRG